MNSVINRSIRYNIEIKLILSIKSRYFNKVILAPVSLSTSRPLPSPSKRKMSSTHIQLFTKQLHESNRIKFQILISMPIRYS